MLPILQARVFHDTLAAGVAAVRLGALVVAAAASAQGPVGERTAAPPSRHGESRGFTYAPGTERYRITTDETRTQDQSGGRAPLEFTNTTTEYVTVTLGKRGGDTLSVVVTLDSTGVSSTLDAPAPDTGKFRGPKLQGAMSTHGEIYSFQPPAGVTDPLTVSLYLAFKRFFTHMPADVAPGAIWVDSTRDSFKRGQFTITTSTVTNSRVAGDTAYHGEQAWRVERNGTINTSGLGEGPNSGIHLAADGTIRGTRFLSQSGVFLGGASTQTTHLEMTRPDTPGAQTAPIQEVLKTTVVRLKS